MKIQSSTKKLDKSRVEIEAEIDAATFDSYEQKALKYLGEHVEVPGFRKGHIPENILVKNIPEIRILEEMAELAVADAYGKILETEKIDAIGRPEIMLTKLAKGNPLAFKIVTAVIPEVTLPDYKKIAKGTPVEETGAVKPEEIDAAIREIRTMRARKDATADGQPPAEIKEEELPVFDDAYVKTIGSFNDVADFTAKLTENIRLEKEHQTNEKRRLKIIEALIEKSVIDVPQVIIDAEIEKMLHRLKGDIQNIGFEFEAYLKQIGKSEDDIRKEWAPEAEKRAKLQLIIEKIADAEKLSADEHDVEHELKHLLEQYKDADPTRARMYIESTMRTDKVFKFLESQK